LRNTEYIYGIVIYTGHETKILKNSPKTRNKISKIERKTNQLINILFIIELLIILLAAGYSTVSNYSNQDTTDPYLGWSISSSVATNFAVSMLINMGSWLLIFVAFIPISLVVTLKIIKFFQAIFISWVPPCSTKPKTCLQKYSLQTLLRNWSKLSTFSLIKLGR
jgi:phospholipid-transporting ATPase